MKKTSTTIKYKICNICNELKSISEFYIIKPSTLCRSTKCKNCYRKHAKYYSANWRKLNPEKVRIIRYVALIKKEYNISYEQYEEMEKKQNSRCAICGLRKEFNLNSKLHVDHDHSNLYVRGLLCANCNRGLANFKDNIILFKKAILYLEKSKQQNSEVV